MFRELLAREFAPYGTLSPAQLDQLESHYGLMLHWNAKLNLTRIDSIEQAAQLHYCESLFAGQRLPPGPLRVVDVGSGAGFPGIPIAILRPECAVTLVESHRRKAVFLSEAIRYLPNVKVVTDRAENLKAEFDWLVSRAINPTEILKLNLANNLAILVGASEASAFGKSEILPWGEHRHLVFHVKRRDKILKTWPK
jgi:16S rRNA (guanine(527)-N(7))-methyltransferase RsmG